MGSAATSIMCILVMATLMETYATNCSVKLEGCVRCDLTSTECTKCRHVMEERTRVCRTACAPGQREAWASTADTIGRVCLEAGVWAGLGLSGQGAAVVVGCLVGVGLSISALLAAVVYIRRRAQAQLLACDDSSDSTLTVTPLNHNDRREFLTQLGGLRKDAPTFLAMLNETRAQARRATSMQPYRPVLKDLLTLMLLLNTPESRVVTPPPDWRRLLAWSERVLRRYKRQSQLQLSNNAVGELVSFLPHSSVTNTNTMSTTGSSTLQSRIELSLSRDPLHHKQKTCTGWNNNVRRTSILDSDDCLDTSPVVAPNHLNKFSFADAPWDSPVNTLPLWSVPSKEILSEDDYGKLGFRPQDEITTEL